MRLFSEQEIGAILKRTAELAKQTRPANADGLSLAEIEELAADAGLDPALVARAAAEISTQAPRRREHDLFGGPLSYAADIELEVDVDLDTWETMLPAIRSHFGDPGTVSTREGIFEWTRTGGEMSKKGHVYVRKTGTGSRLHLFWSETTSAVPFYIPTIMAFVLSLPILFEEFELGLVGIPIMIAIVGTMFMLSRFGVVTMKNRNVRKIDSLAQELTRIAYESRLPTRSATNATTGTVEAGTSGLATSAAQPTSTEQPLPRPTTQLDLDDLDAPDPRADDQRVAGTRPRRRE